MLNLGIEDCSIDANKDYSVDEEKIKSLRQRVLGDETLNSRTDDTFLSSFLRTKNYNEDDAFKFIKKYYETRKRFPSVFKNLVPSAVKEALEMNIFTYFKNTDGNGSVMITATCRFWEPSKTTVWDILRSYILFLDSLITEAFVQVNGVILFMDFRQGTWRHLLHITPIFVYTLVSCCFLNYPVQYKQIHVITDSATTYWFTVAFLPFFPREIRAKTHVHSSDFESLHKIIDPKYLPADYEGDLPPFDSNVSYKELHENEKFFEDSESYWNNSEYN